MPRLAHILLAGCLGWYPLHPVAGAEELPPAFSTQGFDAAQADSRAHGRILVVKFTAQWCKPCKQMDLTTWRDPEVVAWCNSAQARAIQVDVDAQGDVAARFSIRAMPTMMAIRNGHEIGRVVGYRDAAQILDWFKELEALVPDKGAPSAEAPSAEAPSAEAPSAEAPSAEALSEEERTRPRRRLLRLREQQERALMAEAGRTWDALTDWLWLNSALDDHSKTLAWFDRIKHDVDAVPTIARSWARIEPALLAAGRADDLRTHAPEPLALLRGRRAARAHAIRRGCALASYFCPASLRTVMSKLRTMCPWMP